MKEIEISQELRNELEGISLRQGNLYSISNGMQQYSPYICNHLETAEFEFQREFYKYHHLYAADLAYKNMIKNDEGDICGSWWSTGLNDEYLISEKYAFIQDILNGTIRE